MFISHKLTIHNCYLYLNLMVDGQGTFLPLIVPPTIYQAGLWSTWLTVLCSLKVDITLKRTNGDNSFEIWYIQTKTVFSNLF